MMMRAYRVTLTGKMQKALRIASLPDDAALSEDVRRYRALLMLAMEKIAHDHRTELREVTTALMPMKQLRGARN